MDNKKLITTFIVFLVVLAALIVIIVSASNFGGNNIKPVKPNQNISGDSSTTTIASGESISIDESDNTVFSSSVEDSSVEVLIPQLVLPPDVSLVSNNVLVYSEKYDAVIYEKNADAVSSPASITKLVTALVVLDHLDIDKVLRVGSEIKLIGANSSTAWLYQDQYLTVEALIDAMLIPSGNDAAYTLAVNTADSLDDSGKRMEDEAAVAAFVQLMNDKVKSLGCKNTVFCTPDGYDAEGQQTTARDLLIISKAAYENEIIRTSVGKYQSQSWTNSNALINPDSRYYDERVTGLKTGSTADAGYCVTVTAELENDTLYMVFLGSQTKEGRFIDAINVIETVVDGGVVLLPK